MMFQSTAKAAERYGGSDFACVLGQEIAGYATGETFFVSQALGLRHSHLDAGGYSYDQKPKGKTVEVGDDAMGRTGDRDTGIAIKSSIFYDLNMNGLKDEGEVGFGGVTVTLYRIDGLLIGDAQTESDGSFSFTGLDPDRYYMIFGPSGTLTFTTQSAGGATSGEQEDNDSDVNTVTGQTPDFELTFDETEAKVTAGYKGDPRVSVNDVSIEEGNTGQTMVNVTITLSGPQVIPVTVEYRTEDGNELAALNARVSTGICRGCSILATSWSICSIVRSLNCRWRWISRPRNGTSSDCL